MNDFYKVKRNVVSSFNSRDRHDRHNNHSSKPNKIKQYIEQNNKILSSGVEKPDNKISSIKLNFLLSNKEVVKSKFDINKIFSSPNISENLRSKFSNVYSQAIDGNGNTIGNVKQANYNAYDDRNRMNYNMSTNISSINVNNNSNSTHLLIS